MNDWEAAGENRWMLDKLLLSHHLGYTCGPAGVDAPKGTYIVRPVMNLLGMSIGAKYAELDGDTDHLPVGTFWTEWFEGDYVSVDYRDGEQLLAVRSERDFADGSHGLRASSWWVDQELQMPCPFDGLDGDYNVEFIGGMVTEVNFRLNTDFRWGNNIAIPVYFDDFGWNEWRVWSGWRMQRIHELFHYVEDQDADRRGFYIDVDPMGAERCSG